MFVGCSPGSLVSERKTFNCTTNFYQPPRVTPREKPEMERQSSSRNPGSVPPQGSKRSISCLSRRSKINLCLVLHLFNVNLPHSGLTEHSVSVLLAFLPLSSIPCSCEANSGNWASSWEFLRNERVGNRGSAEAAACGTVEPGVAGCGMTTPRASQQFILMSSSET